MLATLREPYLPSTPLKLFFYAAYLIGSARRGISAKQIQRETGVTYKTAWRMFHRIRSLLPDGDLHLEGTVRPERTLTEYEWFLWRFEAFTRRELFAREWALTWDGAAPEETTI